MIKCIYICGCGHSGSTLLDFLLSSHPNATSLGEVMRLNNLILKDDLCTCGKTITNCDFWKAVNNIIAEKNKIDLLSSPQKFPLSIHTGKKTIIKKLIHIERLIIALTGFKSLAILGSILNPGFNPKSIINNMNELYDAVIQVSHKNIVVDSSKSALMMKWLWMYKRDEIKIIYLVRDGRGVMFSNMRKGVTAENAVRNWVRANTLAQWLLKTIPKNYWYFLRYEDLCKNPEKELINICRFLNIDFFPDMLKFSKHNNHSVGGNRMRFQSDQKIVDDQKWKEELTEDELKIFYKIGGKMNKELDYNDN